MAMIRLVSAAALLLAPAAACPCCPACEVCPCHCDGCSTTVATTKAPTTPDPGPMMKCNLNCFGDGATAVPLAGGVGNGIHAESVETCRDFCLGTDGCEAIVYGQHENMCYGKKDVKTSKCQPTDGDFVTEVLTRLPKGTCIIMGDPHILSFDNPLGRDADNSQLEAGDYTVIKSDIIDVQGRFGYSDRFPSEASLVGLTVTGELLRGQKLTVEFRGPMIGPAGFKVWWNGAEIVTALDTNFEAADGILSARKAMMDPDDVHMQARHTIGGNYGSGKLPSLLFKLALGIEIYCLLGDQTMNAVITMQRMPGEIDGYCGNFNCVSSDDTMPELEKRGLAAPLPTSNFGTLPLRATKPDGIPDKTVNDCSQETLEKAEEACKGVMLGLKQSCIYDVCAASVSASMGKEDVGKEDVMVAGVAKELEDKSLTFAGLHFPRLTSASLAPSLQLFIGMTVMGLAGSGLVAGLSLRGGLRGWAGGERRDHFMRVSGEDDEEALLLMEPPLSEHEPILAAE